MKKLTLFIFLLCCWSSGLKAQYQSLFGNLQTSWNVLNEYQFLYATDSLTVGTDTIINLMTYKKVVFYHLRHNGNNPLLAEALAYIREETATGRAWIKYDNSTPEQLFMNLSLNVSDLFTVSGLNYAVDSVYIKDGRKHVMVQYGYPMITEYPVSAEDLTFVEGIGTTYGFTYDYENSGSGGFPVNHRYPFLLCSWKDNTHIYTHENQNPFFDGCYKEDTIVGIRHNNNFVSEGVTIVPNPASNYFVIEAKGSGMIKKITLLDLLGNTEFMGSALPSKKNIIDVSKFSEGIYIIRIRFSDNKESSEKLIIRH